MNQYKTNTNRIILTDLDLSYALNNTDTVQVEQVTPPHLKKTCSVPNAATAEFVQKAWALLPTCSDHISHRRHLMSSLNTYAQEAAQSHQACLTLQAARTSKPTHLHLFSTDDHRYALTPHCPQNAISATNPDMIHVGKLLPEQLVDTSFLHDYNLAVFIQHFAAGHFCASDVQIDATHCAETYHHNRFTMATTASGEQECVIRDGTNILPLSSISGNNIITRMYLSAAEYQLAICKLYMATAQAAS